MLVDWLGTRSPCPNLVNSNMLAKEITECVERLFFHPESLLELLTVIQLAHVCIPIQSLFIPSQHFLCGLECKEDDEQFFRDGRFRIFVAGIVIEEVHVFLIGVIGIGRQEGLHSFLPRRTPFFLANRKTVMSGRAIRWRVLRG